MNDFKEWTPEFLPISRSGFLGHNRLLPEGLEDRAAPAETTVILWFHVVS